MSDVLTVCIAGKNNIVVDGLKHTIDNYSKEIKICFLPNPSDDGIDTWQLPFLKFANEHNIPRTTLEELYLLDNLIFISLEYSEIVKTKKFKTNQLYNIHFSLLPKYRGMYTSALPILLGEKESGVTLHKIDDGIDTGDIIDQIRFTIDEDDTARDLYFKYLENGSVLFKRNIDSLICGEIKSTPQLHTNASYYSKKSIDYRNLQINFYKTAYEVRNQLRAFTFREYQLPKFNNWSINRAEILQQRSFVKPGTLILEDDEAVVVSSIDYDLKLFKDHYEEFWRCCEAGEIKRLKSLTPYIPDLNLKNQKSWNAIIIATYNGHIEIVKYLVSVGADLSSKNKNGTTLLMYALSVSERTQDDSLFSYLCSSGAKWE